MKIDRSIKNCFQTLFKFKTKQNLELIWPTRWAGNQPLNLQKYGLSKYVFNILDLANINTWIFFKDATGIQIQRKQFLFQLAEEPLADYRAARQNKSLENETKNLL